MTQAHRYDPSALRLYALDIVSEQIDLIVREISSYQTNGCIFAAYLCCALDNSSDRRPPVRAPRWQQRRAPIEELGEEHRLVVARAPVATPLVMSRGTTMSLVKAILSSLSGATFGNLPVAVRLEGILGYIALLLPLDCHIGFK
ncbi:hypothetical protein [Bradyrhizobium cosmicum]|uniref:hypothetical protein n=1 Tax=Bradyrhizobium cosmicum TaxID=1404864 RepID=UPI0028EFC788|nr:hypothetical protein [Bradyrhizobium cosmicum]